jgi:pimeloyl-ACP methyl ester carboxylesterase
LDRALKKQAGRFDVRSADGTRLAVWVDGKGPPLVLVHGSLGDHSRFDLLISELRDRVTTFAMDRRGFGASADASEYALEREFEDVAAVVDAVAARAGGPVALFGHSFGAGCAMGAATLTRNVSHLVLYEPGLGLAYPPGSIEAAEKALAAGDRDAALRFVFVDILEMTDADVDAMRADSSWQMRLAIAPTVPRECRAEESWVYRPGRFDEIAAPTRMLTGSESPASLKEAARRALAALPGAQVRVLDGHGHIATRTDPALVAAVIRQFIAA